MKTYRFFNLMLITGSEQELDKLEQLAAGTHHVHQSQPKGIKSAGRASREGQADKRRHEGGG